MRDALQLRNAGVVYALILLMAVLTAVTEALGRPSYLSGANVANILDQASLVGILAVAMTVVLISGNFDLSVGSSAALSAAVLLTLLDAEGWPVAVLAALATGTAVGVVNGLIVQLVGINAFIVTLGTLTAVRGLVLVLTDARTITARAPASRDAMDALQGGRWTIGLVVVGGLLAVVGALALARRRQAGPAAALIAGGLLLVLGLVTGWQVSLTKPVWYLLAVALLAWAVLRFTVLGRRLYAVGGNAEAARLSGIDVNRYKIAAFILAGLAAGVVGILSAAELGAINPTGLQGLELTVIAAAILGGTSLFGGSGSVVKSVIGALILFALANGFNVLNLGATYQGLIEGIVLIIAAGIYTVAARDRRAAPVAAAPPETGATLPDAAPEVVQR